MQFQYDHEMQTTRLRFVVDDPDALFEGYQPKDFLHDESRPADTP